MPNNIGSKSPTNLFDLFPTAQTGGLRLRPVCGVLEGFEPSVSGTTVAGIKNTTTDTISVTFSAGKLKIDGKLYTFSSSTTVEIDTNVNLTTASNLEYEIYINAPRVVPASTTAPSNPATGDRYIRVNSTVEWVNGDYQVADKIFKYGGSPAAWRELDYLKGNEFPSEFGVFNNNSLGELKGTISASDFSTEPEKPVYYTPTDTVPYLAVTTARVLARVPIFLSVCKLVYNGGSGSIIRRAESYLPL